MDNLLAAQSRARLIAAAPPRSLNGSFLASAVKPRTANSYHSSRKTPRHASSRFTATVSATNPNTNNTSEWQQS
jgi:hypothetical protein